MLTWSEKRILQSVIELIIMQKKIVDSREVISDAMLILNKTAPWISRKANRHHLAGMLRHVLYQNNSIFYLKQRYPGTIAC